MTATVTQLLTGLQGTQHHKFRNIFNYYIF